MSYLHVMLVSTPYLRSVQVYGGKAPPTQPTRYGYNKPSGG